ncbi:MAG TPA: polysaccharide lyase [Coleofasciculaceae cyanobacterium]|jgi:hypothetical protein
MQVQSQKASNACKSQSQGTQKQADKSTGQQAASTCQNKAAPQEPVAQKANANGSTKAQPQSDQTGANKKDQDAQTLSHDYSQMSGANQKSNEIRSKITQQDSGGKQAPQSGNSTNQAPQGGAYPGTGANQVTRTDVTGNSKDTTTGTGSQTAAQTGLNAPAGTAANPQGVGAPPAAPPNGKQLFNETFESGQLSKGTSLEKPTPNSAQVIDDPTGQHGKVLKIDFNRENAKDSKTSRVEILSGERFQQGKEYTIQWSNRLDSNFQFDSKQQEAIGQIHHEGSNGSPPFLVGLEGDQWIAILKDDPNAVGKKINLGTAKPGEWSNWKLDWKPSPDNNGYYQLSRNGQQVLDFKGKTSYDESTAGYFKVGDYKWDWQKNPSDVTNRTLFLDDVSITQR